MAMMKRFFLFFAVNIAMMITISLVLRLLGVDRYFYQRSGMEISYSGLALACFAYGMTASFLSLAMSRFMAKMFMGVELIDPQSNGELGELARTVHRLAQAARLPAMPEVGIYESPEVNAFATGPSKARSLVAVSSGLLRTMDRSEVEGVLAHEISHIANGDMVTLTLIQGVVNAFVLFFSKIAAMVISNALSGNRDRDERPSPWLHFAVEMFFQVVLGLIGAMIVAHFSRWREFRADSGGATLAGREKMRGALLRLRAYSGAVDQSHPSLSAFKINGGMGGFLALLATHPPLDERIRRLETMRA